MTQLNLPPRKQCVYDRDFDWNVGSRTIVMLNGERVEDATAYDCDEGWVRRFAKDEDGRMLTSGCIAVEEQIEGTVTVEWVDEE